MRLRRREVAARGTAEPEPEKENIPSKPQTRNKVSQAGASRSKTKVTTKKSTKNCAQDDTASQPDENTPVICSDGTSRSAISRGSSAAPSTSNARALRSKNQSVVGSKAVAEATVSSSKVAPIAKGKSTKKTRGEKKDTETAVETAGQGSDVSASVKVAVARVTSAAASAREIVASSPDSIPSEESESDHNGLPERSNIPTSPAEDAAGERIDRVAGEGTSAAAASPSSAKIVRASKAFYGQAASPSAADDMQQRLKELSFTRRSSFAATPSPAAVPKKKKKGNVRPRAFKAASKRAKKTTTKDCCGGGGIVLLGGKKPDAETLRSRRSNKFFKHHIPLGQYRCVLKGGVPRFITGPSRNIKKGLIDFDFKEDEISHVAEEGGKCNNFGLASVEDLERDGIPKANLLRDTGFNLRKRKVAPEKAQMKRRRASAWKYAEDAVPDGDLPLGRSPRPLVIGSSPGNLQISSPTSLSNGVTLETPGEPGASTEAPENNPVPELRRKRPGRTRAAPAVAVQDQIISELKPSSEYPNDGAVTPNARRLRSSRAAPAPALTHAATPVRTGNPEVQHKILVHKEPVEPQTNATSKPTEIAPTAEQNKPEAGTDRATTRRQKVSRLASEVASDAVPVAEPEPSPELNAPSTSSARRTPVRRRTTAPPPEPEVQHPSREVTPEPGDATTFDFSPGGCESPRLSPLPSPSPPPSPSCSGPHEPSPVPGCSREPEKPTVTPLRPSVPVKTTKTKPYNPLDDAFGFGRMQFNVGFEDPKNPFAEVPSPTKRPKELTPKIMAPKKTQLTMKDAFKKTGDLVTSTPSKKNVSFRLSGTGTEETRFTSTPAEYTSRRGFYGAASSSKANTDGFKGLKRLIDRLGPNQLQIDAGQKKYGAKECKTCGMIFSQGEAEDEREHQKFHKQMESALQVKYLDACRVVEVLPGVGRAILVNAKDSKRVKDKLCDVLTFANRTIGLDQGVVCSLTDPERMFAAFVHDSGKIVSVIGAEPCSLAHRTTPGQGLMVDTSKRHAVKSSIFFIWTLPEFRRKGLASLLLFKLRAILAAQREPLTFDELAFADMTPDLHEFVKSLSGQDTVLVAAPPDPNLEALL